MRGKVMKKNFISIVLVICLFVGFSSTEAKATFTVATFADPSNNNSNPLFEANFTEMTLNGGWSDTKTGLLLNIPCSGNTYADAWFNMTEVEIIDTLGNTGGGEINFYANGTSIDPLLIINFDSGYVSLFNFGSDEMFVADNVTITGSEISSILSEREFSFNFANLAHMSGSQNWNDGFTATSAFTSSAVPEPATICLLGFGVLSLVKRKK